MAAGINSFNLRFNYSSMLSKVIVINVAIFLALRVLGVVCHFSGCDINYFISFLEWPSSPAVMATQPWSLISYMFAHYDFLHIIFNMLWLYWFGMYFYEFGSHKQFLLIYILGGIGGAILFAIMGNGMLIGASASILAIVAATAIVLPNYEMNLLIIGAVKLKWVAIITILIDFLSIAGENSGGHISHLGGAIVGLLFGLAIIKGVRVPSPKKVQKRDPNKPFSDEEMAKIDAVLDKIKKSGYESLSDSEKRTLFKAGKK